MATDGDVPTLGFGAGAIRYVTLFGFGGEITSVDSYVRGGGSSYRTVIKAHRQVRLQKLPVQNPYKKHIRNKPTWLV